MAGEQLPKTYLRIRQQHPKLAAAIDELGIRDNPGAVEALTKDVYGLVDALAGKYKPIESVKVAKWNRRVANYETVAHLGLVSLASFPEMAAPAIQFGFVPTAYARGAAHAVLEATAAAERVLVGGARKTPKLKAAQALENLGAISLNSIQSTQASRFTSLTTNFTTKFMHATGLELLTDIQKVIAYDTLNTVLRRSAKAVAKGKSGKHKRLLEELGVKAEDAVKWVEEGMPETGPLGDLMENAKLRGQRWAITQPNAATKPLLFSDPHWTNVLLFKSFTSVFSNTFLKRAMSQLGLMKGKGETLGRRAGVIGGMAASVAIAYYTQYLREKINGRRIKQDELQRWVNAFDRAALSGPLTYAWTLVSPYRYGFTDSGSQRLFNLMGPVGGDLGKLFDAAFNTEISDKKRKELAIKAIPVVNITEASREAVLDVVD